MTMNGGKKYGLTIPNRAKGKVVARASVFCDDDDDDEDEAGLSTQSKAVKKVGSETVLKRKTQLEIDKALAEDPTIYEYDAIYDKIQEEKNAKIPGATKDKEKKPKYIQKLMEAAEQRKKEYERRIERQVQKEREAEKGQFEDKETFVTSSYRKKMQELAEEEEKERRQAELEAKLDVTRQNDLSGFYRHLLMQTTGEETVPDVSKVKTEPSSNDPATKQDAPEIDYSLDRDMTESDGSTSTDSSQTDSKEKRESGETYDMTRNYENRQLRSASSDRFCRRSRTPERERHRQRSPKRQKHKNRSPERGTYKYRHPERIYRSRTPDRQRKRSNTPDRQRKSSRTPDRQRKRSRTPDRQRRRSRTPDRHRKRSRTPSRQRKRSRSADRQKKSTRTPERQRKRSRTPERQRKRSGSPKKDQFKSDYYSHKDVRGRKSENLDSSKNEENEMPQDKLSSSRRKHKDHLSDDGSTQLPNPENKDGDSKRKLDTTGEKAKMWSVKFAKRNVGETMEEAKLRYLARRQNRQIAITVEQD